MIREAFLVIRLRGHAALICLLCDQISYHPEDVTQRYCGACGTFLDEVPELYRRPPRAARAFPGWLAWPSRRGYGSVQPAPEEEGEEEE